MFDEHRKYAKCAFCDSTDLTKEHLFGKTLAKEFPVRSNWVAAALPLRGSSPQTFVKGSSPILNLAPSLVCKKCNNGKLSVEMAAVLPLLLTLIRKHRHQITTVERAALRRYWERVGLLVDICTSNRDITPEYRESKEYQRSGEHRQYPPIISESARASWIAGDRLDRLQVFAGTHRGVLGINPVMNIAPMRQYDLEASALNQLGKKVLMTVGGLSVAVFVGLDVAIVPPSFLSLDGSHSDWRWPLHTPVSYDDFFSLWTQTPDILQIRAEMRIKERRRQVEQYSTEVGAFACPPRF